MPKTGTARTSRKASPVKGAAAEKALKGATAEEKEAPSSASKDIPVAKPKAGSKGASKDASVAKKPSTRKPAAKQPVDKPETNGHVELGFLAGYVGFHLRLAQDASYRAFARHRDKDLIKPGRFPALAIIHLNPGISQSALGRAIARDKSTVSPLIKDLQKNGFISRKPSPSDRRSVTLALTKKGERTLERLQVRAQDHESEIDRLVGTSKARLLTLLDKITGGLTE